MSLKNNPAGVSGRRWKFMAPPPDEMGAMIAKGVHGPVAKILSGRGIKADDALWFLEPKISTMIPPEGTFPGMKEAVDLFADAVMRGVRIGIWTDYDCDGATSAATLGRFLRMCGHEDFVIRVPDRISEGYGPNRPGIDDLFEGQGCDTVFVLDSGTVATGVFDPMPAERRAKIAVIDHHLPGDVLPQIAAVVNPNRKDQAPGLGHLCAAGVTFFFCIEAVKGLQKRGHLFPKRPDMTSLLDIVALGTVADVVPLTGVNRAIVTRGLRVMNEDPCMPIRELLLACGMDPASGKKANAHTCGFQLGPRINAEGRIGDASAGTRLLLETDERKARQMALKLNEINRERQMMEQSVTQSARDQVEQKDRDYRGTQEHRIRIAVVPDAHEGIVGISAARIKESFNAPAIVLTKDEHGNLKGSARSVPGFSIGEAIHHAADAGLILKGGGHGMAGGLTLEPDKVEALEAFMNEEIARSEYGRVGVFEEFDAVIQPEELTIAMIQQMESLQPFGTGNPNPRVVVSDLTIMSTSLVGKDPKTRNISVLCKSKKGTTISGIIFRVAVDGSSPEEAALQKGNVVTLAGKIEIDTYAKPPRPKIMISDILMPDPEPELTEVADIEDLENAP